MKSSPSGLLLVAIAGLLVLSSTVFAQLPTPTYGWNLGNTLEPPTGEGTWGPAATQNLINSVADSGFNTVRIPVAWDSHANQSTYQIDAAWMARVKQVVDWCYVKNLHVIINCHWDNGWLENNITGTVNPTINAKMNSYWTQIATTFRNYDNKLIFAGANEPNADTAAEVSTLMTYYQTFIDAVRATGDSNISRWLVIQGPNTDIDLTDTLMNTLPTDPTTGRLMVEVHYYSPYQWTLMSADADWGKMFYFWGQAYHHATRTDRNANWGEEAYVNTEFEKMRTKFISRGIPVILGEFQAFKRAVTSDLTGADYNLHVASRTFFHKTVVDVANSKGLKPIYWDIAGQMFNWNTGAIVDPDNKGALTGGAAIPPGGVHVDVAPAITTQPLSQTIIAGNAVSFSSSASGDPIPTYQWKKNNANIGGATGNVYQIASVDPGDAGSYTVVATNSAGSATSDSAMLTVNVPPAFTTDPGSQTVLSGANATFTVAASGSPAPTYRWQCLPAGSGTWADLSSAGSYTTVTTATLSVNSATDAMNGDQFRCVATNGVSSATSASATLTVTALPPAITTQPVSKTVVAGSGVNFSVVASSSVPLTYQWCKDTVAISGATSSSYAIANVQGGSVGSYTVVVTNSGGAVTSSAAALALGTIPAGFDVSAYLVRYPAVAALYSTDFYGAWIYYRDSGIYQGQVFDELFRVEEYLTLYPELFAIFGSDLSGTLVHWLTQGSIEGRLGRIPLVFSAPGYLDRNPDVAAAVGGNTLLAWQHYWAYGIYEGRAYDDELDVFGYLAVNADLTAAFVNDWRAAALHWMRYGRTEGRLGRVPLIFNVTEYLNRYPPVGAAWGTYPTTVFLHYWLYGIDEGKNFDDLFRPVDYLALNPDLAAVFGTDRRGAFKHWVRYGQAEGRPGRNP